jgi:hypothetical protein
VRRAPGRTDTEILPTYVQDPDDFVRHADVKIWTPSVNSQRSVCSIVVGPDPEPCDVADRAAAGAAMVCVAPLRRSATSSPNRNCAKVASSTNNRYRGWTVR